MHQNRALFLDRDGIINQDYGYVATRDRFDFLDGIFDVCRHALSKNYLVIVITNQSGIARGLYTVEDFLELTSWMTNEFEKQSITIKQVYFCPHYPESNLPEFAHTCNCRKPKPGLFLNAAKDHNINLTQSIAIGDKARDLIAAHAAGVGTKILLSYKGCNAADRVVQSHAELIKFL